MVTEHHCKYIQVDVEHNLIDDGVEMQTNEE